MKLNLRPNKREISYSQAALITIVPLLATLANCSRYQTSDELSRDQKYSIGQSSASQQEVASKSQESSGEHDSSYSGGNRGQVRNLSLTADFRAVKLRWSYNHDAATNEPAAFLVR